MATGQLILFFLSNISLFAAAIFVNKRRFLKEFRLFKRGLIFLSVLFFFFGLAFFPVHVRFASSLFFCVCGLIMLAGSLYLIISGLRWDFSSQLEDARIRLKVQGVYRFIRNPLYMGSMAAVGGLVFLYRSYYGLISFLFYIIAVILLILMEEYNFQMLLGETYLEYKNSVSALRPVKVFKDMQKSEIVRYPFKNLVFKGGGIRGVAYIGVLDSLHDKGIIKGIERVAGTSAGAITATLVSFKLDYEETISLLKSLDYSNVPQARDLQENNNLEEPRTFLRNLSVLTEDIHCTNRLIKNFGWYSSDYFYNWMQDVVAKQCDGNPKATFNDFRKKGFRDLYIVAANATRHKAEMFCAELTPDVPVADAVRLSMSIPLFFEALQYDGQVFGQGDYYMDGGIYDNYPIKYFDEQNFIRSSRWVSGGINWETLGCYLYTPENCENNKRNYKNLIGYVENLLVDLAMEAREQLFLRDVTERKRTIMISDCCIMPTEFHLAQDKERFDNLVETGKVAAADFLKDYRIPI